MKKSSEKKKKDKKTKGKKSKKKEIELDSASFFTGAVDIFAESQVDSQTFYKPKDVSDDVRFLDSCPGCSKPETYESFNGGKKVVVTVDSEIKTFEIEDYGSGMTYKYFCDGKEHQIDYCTLNYLIRITQIMEAVQDSNIIGNGWWVDHKGRVGDFNNLLQNYKEERNNKYGELK